MTYQITSVLECQTETHNRIELDISYNHHKDKLPEVIGTITITIPLGHRYCVKGMETAIKKELTRVNKIIEK
jgi:hypothetical protein